MSDTRRIIPGDIYKHFKDKLYQIVSVAYHSETGEKYVVYQALYGEFKTYVMPYDRFVGQVDTCKYPDAEQKYRFEKAAPEQTVSSEAQTEKLQKDENNTSEGVQAAAPPDMLSPGGLSTDNDGQVNPYLLEFFDKEGSRAQIEYLNSIRNKIDDRLINDIAVSLDLTVDEGALEDRIQSLINCLKTKARFECERLR